jgi:quinol-cytochrome oxidoreductase complex cytochrome b subunit
VLVLGSALSSLESEHWAARWNQCLVRYSDGAALPDLEEGQESALFLARFWLAHLVDPLTLLAVMGLHLYMVIKIGITAPPERHE